MPNPKGLQDLVDLAKKYVLTEDDASVIAERQRLSTALKVADRLAQAAGTSSSRMRLSEVGAPTLSPMARLKLLHEAGFDIDNSRYQILHGPAPTPHSLRVSPEEAADSMYHIMHGSVPRPNKLYVSPEAAIARHNRGMEDPENLMAMLGMPIPSRMQVDPNAVEDIKLTASYLKESGKSANDALSLAIDSRGRSFYTVPVFTRRPEGEKVNSTWNWYEEDAPLDSENMVSIFGHPDEAGQFAKGGLARGGRFYRGVDRIAPDNEARFMPYRPWDNPKKTGMQNVPLKAGWVASNPNVASSYAVSGPGGVVMPVRMTADPDIILDAEGANWRDFFDAYIGGSRRGKFYQGMRDPDVKSIEVQNVVDPGTGTWSMLDDIRAQGNEGMSLSDMLDKYFMSNNVLVKDPGIIRYDISDEPVTFEWMGRDHGR